MKRSMFFHQLFFVIIFNFTSIVPLSAGSLHIDSPLTRNDIVQLAFLYRAYKYHPWLYTHFLTSVKLLVEKPGSLPATKFIFNKHYGYQHAVKQRSYYKRQQIYKLSKPDILYEPEPLLPHSIKDLPVDDNLPGETNTQDLTRYSLFFEATNFAHAFLQQPVQTKNQSAQPKAHTSVSLVPVETVMLTAVNEYDDKNEEFTAIYASNTPSYANVPREAFELSDAIKQEQSNIAIFDVIEQWGLQQFARYGRVREIAIDVQLRRDDKSKAQLIPANMLIKVHNDFSEIDVPENIIVAVHTMREAQFDKGAFVGYRFVSTFTKHIPQDAEESPAAQDNAVGTPPAQENLQKLQQLHKWVLEKINRHKNQELLLLLSDEPSRAASIAKLLVSINQLFLMAFGDGASIPHFVWKAQEELFEMKWPADVPQDNELYEQFLTFKEELKTCGFNCGVNHKAHKRAQIFNNFCKHAYNEEWYHQIMQDCVSGSMPGFAQVYTSANDVKKTAQNPSSGTTKDSQPAQQNNNCSTNFDYQKAAHLLQSSFHVFEPYRFTGSTVPSLGELLNHNAHTNGYKTPRSCRNDPFFKRNRHRNDSIFRAQAAKRACLQEDIIKSIGASNIELSDYVDELLFKIVDHCEDRQTIAALFNEIAYLSIDSLHEEDRKAYKLFFYDTGICKFIGQPVAYKILLNGIFIDYRINQSKNTYIRTLLNYFMSLPIKDQHTAELIRTGITYCSRACEPSEVGKAYERLAIVYFNAYLNQTHPLILKCGNFARNLPNPQQCDVQTKIALRVAHIVGTSGYITGDTLATFRLALLDKARQLNDEGKPDLASKVLLILDELEANGQDPDETDKQNTENNKDSVSAKKYDRDRAYQLNEKIRESERGLWDHRRLADQLVEYKASVLEESGCMDDRMRAFLKYNKALQDVADIANALHRSGAHETAENFLAAITKIMYCAGNFAQGVYEGSPLDAALHPKETFQRLKGLAQLFHYLVPKEPWMVQVLITIRDGCEAHGVLDQARRNPLTASLILASDLAKFTCPGVPNVFERAQAIVVLAQHMHKEGSKFITHASAEQWSRLAGNIASMFFMPAYLSPHFIISKINKLTGAGKAISPFLARLGKHIARSANAEQLIKDLERFGLEETYIEELLYHVDREAIRIGHKATPHLQAIEQSLKTAVIAQEIQKLLAAGQSVDEYLKKIGQMAGRYGLQGGKFANRLIGAGLNEAQISTIMCETYNAARSTAFLKGLADIDALEYINFKHVSEELGSFFVKQVKAGNPIDLSIYKNLNLVNDVQLLEEGIKELRKIEGAMGSNGAITKAIKEPLKPTADPKNIKGSMYEIERGLKFKKEGKKIDFMGYHPLDDPRIKKMFPPEVLNELREKFKNLEYDVKIEGNLVIECKDVNWNNLTKKDLDSFVNHNDLAQKIGMNYEVYSKQKIPQTWKQKLLDKGIKFFEE